MINLSFRQISFLRKFVTFAVLRNFISTFSEAININNDVIQNMKCTISLTSRWLVGWINLKLAYYTLLESTEIEDAFSERLICIDTWPFPRNDISIFTRRSMQRSQLAWRVTRCSSLVGRSVDKIYVRYDPVTPAQPTGLLVLITLSS